MGEGIVREFGIDMYTLLYFKWITNKDLLYSQKKKKIDGVVRFFKIKHLLYNELPINKSKPCNVNRKGWWREGAMFSLSGGPLLTTVLELCALSSDRQEKLHLAAEVTR